MHRLMRARCGRLIFLVMPLLAGAASVARAQTVLTLQESVELALAHQPRVEAPLAMARAAREAAVAERQLPDPMLSLGLTDVPVQGPDAFNLRRDEMTQVMVEFSQEFPRANTRRLRGEKALLEADAADAMARQMSSEVRRDTTVAWFQALAGERAQRLAEAEHAEAQRLEQATEIAYRAGKASQAEVLEARVEAAMAEDRIAELRLQAKQARTGLSRWIGEAAYRPLPQDWPSLTPPASLESLLELAHQHHHLDALATEVEVAGKAVALAQDDYRPAWSLDFFYANRPDFSDMVGARVSVGLPLFSGGRQDRRLAASVARREEAQARRDDALNEQSAEVRELWAEYEELSSRLQRFDSTIIPAANQRVAAAEAAYGAGDGSLGEVYRSRRALLDTQIRRLELAAAHARTLVRFHYFAD